LRHPGDRVRRAVLHVLEQDELAEALEVLPEIDQPLEPEEPEEVQEFCTVIDVQGEVVVIRSGKTLSISSKPGITVRFSSNAEGVLLAWKEEVGIVHLSSGFVSVGDTAKGTGKFMFTRASSSLCGRILDATGTPIDGRPPPPVPANYRMTFAEYKNMQERTNQYRPLFTGVLGVDFPVPIGRGQTMLFQGTDPVKDRQFLWPDLLGAQAGPRAKSELAICVCVCTNLEEAEALRCELEKRGSWEHCALIVSRSTDPGAVMVAMNAAVAFAEQICDQDGEALVLMDLEPMHRVWNLLAGAAGNVREGRMDLLKDFKDDGWTDMDGTFLRESIAERRKFWFALVSRAANSEAAGSVSLLPWFWEQAGGLDHRAQQALALKLQRIVDIPRISGATKQKMIEKVKEEARAAGLQVDGEAQIQEPAPDVPGVPNWEMEELKSISDGHILLEPPTDKGLWSWRVDPYKSLPRLGTDAMHPALISVGAHNLRLKMMQGRDRADMLHDSLGAELTLDDKQRLDMRFIDLILEQPAGRRMTVEEQVAELVIVANPNCRPLRQPGGRSREMLECLKARLLDSEAGKRMLPEPPVLPGVQSNANSCPTA